jgi:RNA polymerase sigma-70 factor (ECF subfamily)
MENSHRGDLEAFSTLVQRHEKTLVNFLFSMGVSYHEMDDIAQNVWLKVYDYRDRYKESAKFSTFLYRIAKQRVIDSHRHNSRFREVLGQFKEWLHHKNEQQERARDLDHGSNFDLDEKLEQLEPLHREVIALKYFEGLSLKEIAELLILPLGTVKSRLHNGIHALKEACGER